MLVRAAVNANSHEQAERQQVAQAALEGSLRAHERMVQEGASSIAMVASVLVDALSRGNKVFFCGNGGSAADAQHAAAELVGRFYRERSALAALSLTTDTSVLTAVGNDWAFDEVFARQVHALGVAGDVIVGMTTSGRSENIRKAFDAAREKNMVSVALTGIEGRTVGQAADVLMTVPSSETPRIQELHILALHCVCEIVESALFRVDEAPAANCVAAGVTS